MYGQITTLGLQAKDNHYTLEEDFFLVSTANPTTKIK
jgi:hypothetical protein